MRRGTTIALADLLKLAFIGRILQGTSSPQTSAVVGSSSTCCLAMTAQTGTPHWACCILMDTQMPKVSMLSMKIACLIAMMTSQQWVVYLMMDQNMLLSKWIPQWLAMVWTWECQSSWFEVFYWFSTCGRHRMPVVLQQIRNGGVDRFRTLFWKSSRSRFD